MRQPLTVLRFIVPSQIDGIAFALRELKASIVGKPCAPAEIRKHLADATGTEMTISYLSEYGQAAAENLDYLTAKLKAAGSRVNRSVEAIVNGESHARDLASLILQVGGGDNVVGLGVRHKRAA